MFKALLILIIAACVWSGIYTSPYYWMSLGEIKQYLKYEDPFDQWQTNNPAYFNLSNDLKLSIPSKYQQFWLQKNKVPRTEEDMKNRKNAGSLIGFEFFLPDFSGYTKANHKQEFHPDRVNVIVEARRLGEEKDDAPGNFAPNMRRRVLKYSNVKLDEPTSLKYGLECYADKDGKIGDAGKEIRCFGVSDDQSGRMIQMTAILPPYPNWVQNPSVQASYFSPEHGGIFIIWRTHMKNFSEWKKIDQQIWVWLDEWKVK